MNVYISSKKVPVFKSYYGRITPYLTCFPVTQRLSHGHTVKIVVLWPYNG